IKAAATDKQYNNNNDDNCAVITNKTFRQTPSLLQSLYCFFFPSRTLFSTRFFQLLFSSSSFPSFSSLPLLPTAGPTVYRDDRNRPAYAIRSSLAVAPDTLTHTQGTRPEGLGGLRNAGPAIAGPRPPYVIEAIYYSGYTL
ncbi:hypothetical protein L249_5637, partial [Ophiocordyceps polyrhachis-furcata BCC 54312]